MDDNANGEMLAWWCECDTLPRMKSLTASEIGPSVTTLRQHTGTSRLVKPSSFSNSSVQLMALRVSSALESVIDDNNKCLCEGVTIRVRTEQIAVNDPLLNITRG